MHVLHVGRLRGQTHEPRRVRKHSIAPSFFLPSFPFRVKEDAQSARATKSLLCRERCLPEGRECHTRGLSLHCTNESLVPFSSVLLCRSWLLHGRRGRTCVSLFIYEGRIRRCRIRVWRCRIRFRLHAAITIFLKWTLKYLFCKQGRDGRCGCACETKTLIRKPAGRGREIIKKKPKATHTHTHRHKHR